MQAATACEDKNNFILVSPKKEKTKQKNLEKVVVDRAYAPLEIERISTISAGHNLDEDFTRSNLHIPLIRYKYIPR